MRVAKSILFILLLALLWLPLLQMNLNLVKSDSLKGAFIPHSKPLLNDSTWFDGSFQYNYELYLNDTLGFHQDFIRLRNQLDYSLYSKCHSYDIELGKDGYLVATTHMDAYLGKTKTRVGKIDTLIRKLAQLSDTLARRGKTLLFVIAPSRGSFCLDKAPDWYDTTKVAESDYEVFLRMLKNTTINYIDFDKSFLRDKKRSKYPLYSKCGVHWSNYGAYVAGDSIVRHLEYLRKIDLPDLVLSRLKRSYRARKPDADLNAALNLIWPVKNELLAYPVIYYNKLNKDPLKTIIIGDSYFFNIGINYIPEYVFSEYEFWYYNNTVFSSTPNSGKSASSIDIIEAADKTDVFIIMATQINLGNVGWGFIERANALLCSGKGKKLSLYIDRIKSDSLFNKEIIRKAKLNNKSYETQLLEDAEYQRQLELGNQ